MIHRFACFLFAVILLSCNDDKNASATANNDSTSTGKSDTTRNNNAALQMVFKDSTYQLTGVAKEEGGRLFINYPRWSGPYRYGVVFTTNKDSTRPFPNDTMNLWSAGKSGAEKWVCVQSVYVDDGGTLWVLDPSAPQMQAVQGKGAKLVKMNKDGTVAKTYSFTGTISDTSYVNDVRIDVQRNFAYITDSKTGCIVVVDLGSGKMRKVLTRHSSTKSDTAFKFIIDGKELIKEGKPVKINSDGIALTPDGAWLYYKPLTDDKLYRIATEHLRNWDLVDTTLFTKVEDLGHFNTTDGMIFDKASNLYMGDLQNYSIVRLDKDHKKTVLVKDERLIWPDSYAIADGYLYITCSQINKQPDYNNGVNKRTSPYAVYRLKL
jgi:sugar lactone lactonase YvrE